MADTDDLEDRLGAITGWAKLKLLLSSFLQQPPPTPAVPAPPPERTSVSFLDLLTRIKNAPNTPLQPRATRATDAGGYEYIEPAGEVWCTAVGVTPDEGALARMIASEVGGLPPQYMVAVAEAVRNEARVKHITPFQRITMAGLVLANGLPARKAGYFGRQAGRWCASLNDPTRRHLEAARVALAADTPLIARSARRWVDGKVMDHGTQAGKKLAYNAVTLVEKWGKEGWEWIGPVYEADGLTPLIDPYVLMLFAFVGAGKANIAAGVAAMLDGRRRWRVTI